MCSNSSQLIQWPTTSVDVVVTSHFTWKQPGACLFVWLVVLFELRRWAASGVNLGGGGGEDSAELNKTCTVSML